MLPERFGEPHGGNEVSFQVLVKDVKLRKLPEADDEFAKTASEFDTLTQLRDDLRERLGRDEGARGGGRHPRPRAAGHDRHRHRRAARIPSSTRRPSIGSRTPGSGPSAPGSRSSRCWSPKDGTRPGSREDSRDHAIRAIKSDLVLEGIARAEKLEVTADEIGAQIAVLAQAYGREPKELAKALDRSGQVVTLAGDIIRGKALDLLVERADIEPEGASRTQPRRKPNRTPRQRRRRAHERHAELPGSRGGGADQPRRAFVRHLLAPAEGTDRLPGHADRRSGGQPDHGAAPAPGVGRSRTRTSTCTSTRRAATSRRCSRSTTRCSTSSPTCRRS